MLMKLFYTAILISGLVVLAIARNVDGAALLIDFQGVGGNTAAGYQSYEAVNQNLASLGSRNYVSPIPATVEIKVANLPDGASDFRVVDRGPSTSPDAEDWIGVDARLGPPGSSTAGNPRPVMNIMVSNLPDGIYAWSSLHHDPLNQTGVVTYKFSDVDGTSNGTIDISSGGEPMTTFNTTFRSFHGSPTTLSLTVTEPDGTATFAALTSFALVNSLQITPVPEPTAATLLLLGMLWCSRHRGARRSGRVTPIILTLSKRDWQR